MQFGLSLEEEGSWNQGQIDLIFFLLQCLCGSFLQGVGGWCLKPLTNRGSQETPQLRGPCFLWGM